MFRELQWTVGIILIQALLICEDHLGTISLLIISSLRLLFLLTYPTNAATGCFYFGHLKSVS